jgi:hypothetical protein
MADFLDRSGMLTPPPDAGCPVSANATLVNIETPPSPPSQPEKRRRDRLSLQKEREANRSKQFTTRLRSASGDKDSLGKGKRSFQPRQRNSLGSEGSNGEADDQKVLTKMAYAEQQKWITVQQKTFTKWWVSSRVVGIGRD